MPKDPLLSAFLNIRQRLRHIAVRYLPDGESGDDELQEAFCRLWTRRENINTNEEAEALLVTTVKNLSIDSIRKSQSRPLTTLDPERTSITTAAKGADEAYEAKETLQQIEQIIEQRLTPLQQLILQRKEYDGCSFEQLSQELHMEQAAIRMQLSRARKTIRTYYQTRRNDL